MKKSLASRLCHSSPSQAELEGLGTQPWQKCFGSVALRFFLIENMIWIDMAVCLKQVLYVEKNRLLNSCYFFAKNQRID